MTNEDYPIPCPNCGTILHLGDSEDCFDTETDWDEERWKESFTCPHCKTEFWARVFLDIKVTRVQTYLD